jgi:hypothetical protein
VCDSLVVRPTSHNSDTAIVSTEAAVMKGVVDYMKQSTDAMCANINASFEGVRMQQQQMQRGMQNLSYKQEMQGKQIAQMNQFLLQAARHYSIPNRSATGNAMMDFASEGLVNSTSVSPYMPTYAHTTGLPSMNMIPYRQANTNRPNRLTNSSMNNTFEYGSMYTGIPPTISNNLHSGGLQFGMQFDEH